MARRRCDVQSFVNFDLRSIHCHREHLTFFERFKREAEIASRLHHPNIIRVLSYGFDEQLGPYFTMELMPSPQGLLSRRLDLFSPPEVRRNRLDLAINHVIYGPWKLCGST